MKHDKKELKNILSDAHDLIEDEEGWCQGHFALNEEKKLCAPESDEAERWCMVGAIQRAGLRRGADLDTIKAAALVLQATVGHKNLPAYNDNSTHAQVLEKFEEAMDKL